MNLGIRGKLFIASLGLVVTVGLVGGLGLSLVRSFVELHGGSVTLESAVGRGTTVTCLFPLDHNAERTAA